jgi:hypothetical protein
VTDKPEVWRSGRWRIGYRNRQDGGCEVFLLDPHGAEYPQASLDVETASRFRAKVAARVIRAN